MIGWTHLDLPQVETIQNTARVTVGVREQSRGLEIESQLLKRALVLAEANSHRKVYDGVPAVNETAMAFREPHGCTSAYPGLGVRD